METKYININKKIKLAYFDSYVPNSTHGIIFVHGLAEHKGRYEHFIQKMSELNISVFAIDIRGHGESGGKRSDIKDFKQYLSDLDVFIKFIKHEHPELKLALFGHSMGGLIATSYASTYNSVCCLILSNPLLVNPKPSKLFKLVPYKILPFIKIKKRHSESPEMLAYSYQDALANKFFTLRLIGCVFDQGIKFVSKNFQNVKIPVLLLGGEIDPLIKTSNFESLLKKFSSTDKKLIMYANTKHRILQSDKKDDAINDIASWLNRQV